MPLLFSLLVVFSGIGTSAAPSAVVVGYYANYSQCFKHADQIAKEEQYHVYMDSVSAFCVPVNYPAH